MYQIIHQWLCLGGEIIDEFFLLLCITNFNISMHFFKMEEKLMLCCVLVVLPVQQGRIVEFPGHSLSFSSLPLDSSLSVILSDSRPLHTPLWDTGQALAYA